MHTLFAELAAFVVYFLYGSYFEWFFHRYCFHAPKLFPRMFREHTVIHHQVYKGDETYEIHPPHEPEKVTMDWWAMPAMILFHLPLFILVQLVTHVPSIWGGVAAVGVYYSLYESLHWVMHVPESAPWITRTRVFRFINQHHKIHHKYMLSNLNVILPLADLTLGTLRDGDGKRVTLFARRAKAAKPEPAKTSAKQEITVKPVKYRTESPV